MDNVNSNITHNSRTSNSAMEIRSAIPTVADKQIHYKRKDGQYDTNTLALKELSNMTQEVLTADRSELRKN